MVPHLLASAALALTSRQIGNLIFLGVIALFFSFIFVLIPIALFLAAMFEKRRVRALKPAAGESMQKVLGDLAGVISEATARGFFSLGVFSDGDAGIREGLSSLLLSSDHLILMKRQHGKLNRKYLLISRFADERWLITTDIAGTGDLSGLDAQEMLGKASFAGMLLHHRQRIAAYGQPPVSFVAETIVQDLHHHELLRFGLMQAAGLVKSVAGREDTWVYTARGAAKLCAHFIQSTMSSSRRLELGKAKTSEAEILEASIARPLPPVKNHIAPQ